MSLKALLEEHKAITKQIAELKKRRKTLNKQIKALSPQGREINTKRKHAKDDEWSKLTIKEKRQHLIETRSEYEKSLDAAMRDLGLKFEIQTRINAYFADFTIPAIRLVVEVDGSVHDSEEAKRYDSARTKSLQKSGWRVVRFRNDEVASDPHAVARKIKAMFPRRLGEIVVIPPAA